MRKRTTAAAATAEEPTTTTTTVAASTETLVTEKHWFTDGEGGSMTVVQRQRKNDWLTYIELKAKGQKRPDKGMVTEHSDLTTAKAEIDRLIEGAAEGGWTPVKKANGLPASKFTEIPKAGKAKAAGK